jgi:hypothetical protein
MTVNSPSWGAILIHRGLKELIDAEKLSGPLPSVRAVGDALREARKMGEDERRRYREVHWPESFGEGGALPWEASAACLELMREVNLSGQIRPPATEPIPLLGERRVLLPVALWFWQVTLSAPKAPRWIRRQMATQMALLDAQRTDSQPAVWRRIERYLLWQAWRPAFGAAYRASVPEKEQYNPGQLEFLADTPAAYVEALEFEIGTLGNEPRSKLIEALETDDLLDNDEWFGF